MVELPYASTKLTRVMGAIWFPISALGTPFGSTIHIALENSSAIKRLKARAIGIYVGGCPRSDFQVVIATISAPDWWLFDRFAPRWKRDHGRVALDGYEGPEVGRDR